jgi:hypothetical protein
MNASLIPASDDRRPPPLPRRSTSAFDFDALFVPLLPPLLPVAFFAIVSAPDCQLKD